MEHGKQPLAQAPNVKQIKEQVQKELKEKKQVPPRPKLTTEQLAKLPETKRHRKT